MLFGEKMIKQEKRDEKQPAEKTMLNVTHEDMKKAEMKEVGHNQGRTRSGYLKPKVEEIKAELKKQFESRIGPGMNITVKEVDKITLARPGCVTPPPVVLCKVKKSL